MILLNLNRKQFTEAFAIVSAAVPTRTPKEVLKNVLLESDGNTITLSATDTEVHMRYSFDAIGPELKVLVPAARMLAALRQMSGAELTLTGTETQIKIKAGSTKYDFGLEQGEGFPDVPTFTAKSYFKIPSVELREAIQKTAYCVDQGATRYATAGIYLEPMQGGLNLVSTDSKRLAIMPCTSEPVNDPSYSITPVVLIDAMKLVDKSLDLAEHVFVEIQPNSVSFQIGGVSITSQVIQGRFPQYQKIIPEQDVLTRNLPIPVGQFASLINQVRVMESAESTGVDLTFGKGVLRAETATANIGQADAEMPLADDKDPLTLRFGGEYLSSFLKTLDPASSVEVGIINDEDRILMTCGKYRYLLMPQYRE